MPAAKGSARTPLGPICNSLMIGLVDTVLEAVGMDSGKLARSTRVMEMEEEWLEEITSSMMEVKEPIVIKETRKMVREERGMNINIYQEMEYTVWLESELRLLRVEEKMIAKVMEGAEVMEESVVGLESQYGYLNHHGRVHTPLLGPATITEKGVEQGQVIGVSFTGGNDTQADNLKLDWSRVGGVERNIPEVVDVIKYVAEVVEMPRWSTMNYKPSCSKWWDPSDRIYGKYEIYDPYMGKGDGKRRWEKERGTEYGYSGREGGRSGGGRGSEQGRDRDRRVKEIA